MAPPTSEQSGHLAVLEDIANMIQKAQANIKKCPKVRLTEGYIKVRLQSVEEYWSAFKQAHNALLMCTPREQRGQLPYFLNEDYYKYEDLYLCLQGDMTDLLSRVESNQKGTADASNTSTSSHDSQLSFAKLPRIQLPIYSGRYEDWPSFQDLFVALVHNTSLSNVQKLHYLKSSISGEAEMLLRHIQITENNYTQAWELLKGRFGNKKMIVTALLKRLFYQKKMMNQSANQIKGILDTTTECINNFNNLNINTDSWDPVIVFLVSQKLDTESLKDWEEASHKEKSDEMSTWEEMKKFLETKFRTLELVAPSFSKEKPQPHKSFHVTNQRREDGVSQSAYSNTNPKLSCSFCKGGHYIYNCKEFAKQEVEQRREFAKRSNLCFNCLIPNHNVYACKQTTTCRICNGRHHSLLHELRQPIKEVDAPQQLEHKVTTAHFSKQHPGHEVLLATAQVVVQSSNGSKHILRALIDQGSEASFVSARVVDLLKLKKTKISGVVSGVGEGTKITIKHLVDLSVTSRINEGETRQVKAYVLSKISTRLPSKHIIMNWPQFQTLELADPTYYTPGKIDILLGTDVFCKIIEEGLVKLPDGVVAQNTCFGWILSGKRENKLIDNQHNLITLHITRMIEEDDDMLRKFWEIETDLYKAKKILTKEEEICEERYKNTTKRDESGRYIVYLPLKQNVEETIEICGDTKQNAIKRFKQLERKFEKNPQLKIDYTKVIHEYKEMGHMTVSENTNENSAIYLPHHAVIREDKSTSRLRIVFDASAKGVQGVSLNETMLIGPELQLDLRSLIILWRRYKICVVGDIVKMYRMVMVAKEHTDLQRIVWRDEPNIELESYNLTRVTFGIAAAPYLAVRTLNQLADDEAGEFPDTAPLIKTSFYRDDLMIGDDSVEKTKKMCEEIRTILKRGGFEMQKWSSNSEDVLEYLQGKDDTNDTIDIKLDEIIRILGLTWDRKADIFKITVNLPELEGPVTKRSILSNVARLFDPFGWLSPIVITAKVLIQKLWLNKLEWDDELKSDLSEEWLAYRRELTQLQNVKIPRWLKTTSNNKNKIQLHGFADASTLGYAAVAYLRIVEEDVVHVSLLAARTKQPNRWKTFVANRVADITRVLEHSQWRHVQSIDNPADIATRGIQARDLAHHELWWSGPKWLNEENIEYDECEVPETDVEIKNTFHIIQEDKPIWERFSTLRRMKRVLAYCRRFLKVERTKREEGYLTTGEMEKIVEECIKYYQYINYEKEIRDIKRDGHVKKRSSLITFSPFIDEKGLLRVGGRLENASIAESTKYPIIIPSNQHITKLIIDEAHTKTFHGGIQLMMAYIRSKYWVIGLKSTIKKCIRNCKTCIIHKAKIRNQFMGQLPAVRVNQYRPFMNSGVDYAGPVLIKTSRGRGHHATKGYICLFVCMATRAIHLEAVTDLTSQAFIAAFRRFVARRGHCVNLWSDNGTNFIGSAKELKHLFEKGKDNMAREVAELLANDGTKWHFIPPRMPTCGGLWEAGIQSAKRHLIRTNKDTKLTYEELATLLAQIEACLNSRPLCQLDNSSDTPLTPGHFLVGEPLIGVPDIHYEDKGIGVLNRWQLIQKMTQDFWHRWQTEYLNTLQQRHKWQATVPSPSVGDVVIIKDEETPPTKWLLGRISKLHPGADNLVRVVTVRCKGNNELKRPLSKLIPIPTNPQNE